MLIADSSFLVALFLPNDKNHEEALKNFIEATEEIYISNIILYETLTVINYKGSAEEKKQAYNKLLDNKSIVIDHLELVDLDEILQQFVNFDNKLSFADVSVIYLAKKSKSKVLSFDASMKRFV